LPEHVAKVYVVILFLYNTQTFPRDLKANFGDSSQIASI